MYSLPSRSVRVIPCPDTATGTAPRKLRWMIFVMGTPGVCTIMAQAALRVGADLECDEEARDHVVGRDRRRELDQLRGREAFAHQAEQGVGHLHVAGHG